MISINTWNQEFKNSELYQKLSREYQHLFLEYIDSIEHQFLINVNEFTDEQRSYHRLVEHGSSFFYYSFFYYLEFLLEKNPTKIADVGCGINFVKKYVDNVIGFDTTRYADSKEFFDKNFVENHFQEFDCAFAINSLHFISLKNLKNQILDFGKIIKKSGRGFISFNLPRLIEKTPESDMMEIFQKLNPSIQEISDYIDQEINSINDYRTLLYENMIIENSQKIADRGLKEKKYNQLKGSDWPEFCDYQNKTYEDLSDEINDEIKTFYESSVWDFDIADPFNGIIRLVFET